MHGICGLTDFTQRTASGGAGIAGNKLYTEHTLLIQSNDNPVHRTVEGYDFSIAFSGVLCEKDRLISELKNCGYSLITSTDAETILYMYIHYGEKCAEKLTGSFAFAINDCMRRRVFLCCRGQTLTYMRSGTAILFSADERQLFEIADMPPQITADGLRRIFFEGCDRGVLNNVFVLPEEHYMIISQRGIAVKQYADMPKIEEDTEKDVFRVFSKLLKPTVYDTLKGTEASSHPADFIRERNARITDIFEYPCRFEKGSYTDMLRRGLLRAVAEENSPLTALCDTDKLLSYINAEDFSPLAAEFLIRADKLLRGVKII